MYTAATGDDPAAATGAAAIGLAVAGAITRIMALPGVERFFRRFLPFLTAGTDRDDEPAPATRQPVDDGFDQSDRH